MAISIVILAAGLGKRMQSALPKVLHPLAGKPLLEHVVLIAEKIMPSQPVLVVHGHQGEMLQHKLAHLNIQWIEQSKQLGTGHAAQQALSAIASDNQVLILCGDVPLISYETLKELVDGTPKNAMGIITAIFSDPTGFGRVVRDAHNKVIKVVEDKDTDHTQQTIKEINSGIYLVPARYLKNWLPALKNNNHQNEYYLTDIIQHAVLENIQIHTVQTQRPEEVFGVNDRSQLANLERLYQKRIAQKLMLQGVSLLDPNRFDVRGELFVGKDTTIDINVVIDGKVTIGSHCIIGPHSVLRNTIIGDHVEIKAHSLIDGAEVSNHCIIGPFARIRPGTIISEKTHIGNFVEIKNSMIGAATKINHLSYIGDSEIGSQVNIGAGTITCNYDGINKHKTIIGHRAFIGSNTALVAPITIGEEATIGAGSTITSNAPAHQLTLCRAKQMSLANWRRPKKKEAVEK